MAETTPQLIGSGMQDDDDLTLDDVLQLAYRALDEKKGEGIMVLDLRHQVDYLDYIIICTAQTELHAKALVDHLNAELARYDIIPDGVHGYAHGDWIVADYGVFVVHLFLPRTRDYYRLEELWAAGKEVQLR